jgi:2-desacetyl-2-hydroxyethyl bacteriochlorophyllide A dehydrogenase
LGIHAYGSYDIVPANEVIALPSSLDDQPFPAEPLACAMNAFARCEIVRGQDVAVIGVGFLGALLIQLASHAGARVTAFSRRDFALEIATECGAASTVRWDESSAEAESLSERFPRVIEATGMPRALDLATRLVSIRGRLIVAGYHQDSPRSIDMQAWNWKGLDVINAHERDPRVYIAGMKAAVDAVTRGVLDLQSLLTHRFPICEINQAFQLAVERPDGFLKAWVHPEKHPL